MKYLKKSTVKKGDVIPEDENGFEIIKVPENLDDERELLQDAIEEKHEEARLKIQEIIDKVTEETGQSPYQQEEWGEPVSLKEFAFNLGKAGAIKAKRSGERIDSRSFYFFSREMRPHITKGWRSQEN